LKSLRREQCALPEPRGVRFDTELAFARPLAFCFVAAAGRTSKEYDEALKMFTVNNAEPLKMH
jgi:hypothetical protein